MVTLEFGKTPKVTVPDGTYPIPAPRLEVKHPAAKTQDNKGLIPLTLETGEIMWIHPDLDQDEQWDSKKSKSKGKSCTVISILPDDDNRTSVSLSDSEGEKYACTTRAHVPQPTGTRSGKSYLKQYEKATDGTQQQTTSVQMPTPASVPTKGKEKPREVRFDHVLKKTSGLGLTRPFVLTYWPSWLISSSYYHTRAPSSLKRDKRSTQRCTGQFRIISDVHARNP